MRTTRRDAMIVPDRQQGQHASQKRAMHRQMGTHNAVPVLYDTTGSNRLSPAFKKYLGGWAPCRSQSLQQRLHLLTKELAALPRPRYQLDRRRTQLLGGLLLVVLQQMSKMG